MSAVRTRFYRFDSAAQWAQCLMRKWDVQPDGSLAQSARLNSVAEPFPLPGCVTAVAHLQTPCVTPLGEPLELDASPGELGSSPRLVVGRDWIWTFDPGTPTLRRWDRDTLEEEDHHDAGKAILDIATDRGDGVWVLTGEGNERELFRFDCRGCLIATLPVPCQACHAAQLATVDSARVIALLTAAGRKLVSIDSVSGALLGVKELGDLAFGWKAAQMASDGQSWIALWGPQAYYQGPVWQLFVLDRSLEVVEGPLQNLFPNSQIDPASARVAVQGQTVWFSTPTGYWRLAAGDSTGARELESDLMTQALRSPSSPLGRGWLRADLTIELPKGATLEVQFVSTSNQMLKDRADQIASNPTASVAQRQDDIWNLFANDQISHYTFPGPASAQVPVSAPLLLPTDEWLWLRVSAISPPGTDTAKLTELRIHYPYVTLSQSLPAIFQGATNDPDAGLATLLGTIEVTTDRFDNRIRRIGSLLGAQTAPAEWLDFLASWFQLPWDEDLPESAKRCLLGHAGALLEWRGTRRGLLQFLRCLLGDQAGIQISDMTVDYPPLRLSCADSRLPALLAGSPRTTPTVGVKAVLGRAKLCGDSGPMSTIAPSVVIAITAEDRIRKQLAPMFESLLAQYIPAGVQLRVRWRAARGNPEVLDAAGWILDGASPVVLGQEGKVGEALVGGRYRNRLSGRGFTFGRLQ